MRKVRAKLLSKRKFKFYKLKTKKSVQKRFNVVGALRERAFSYHAVGHRHLNKNKSRRDLKRAKRPHFIQHMGDMKKLRCLLPYYRRRKALRSWLICIFNYTTVLVPVSVGFSEVSGMVDKFSIDSTKYTMVTLTREAAKITIIFAPQKVNHRYA